MERDKIYEDLNFTTDISVEDWNTFIKLKLGKYFINDTTLEKNKEILKTEVVNYIRFSEKPEYLNLFNATFSLIKECFIFDKVQTIKILSSSFNDTSNTDTKWMTAILTQPDTSTFSERDKISYYFKVIDETLEGVFKPRFKLLDKLANFKLSRTIIDNSTNDFGKLVKDFPIPLQNGFSLFLKDPIYSITTNQWRNIAAHKSFTINPGNIVVEYGKTTTRKVIIPIECFYKIVYWTQDIYRVIRLAQVLTDLNYIQEIVTELGGTDNIDIRFESSLVHLIHNMQIVGFKFIATQEQEDTFCLKIKEKTGHSIQDSLIHASQCLDRLSCAIYDDKFVRDKFQKIKITIVDDNLNILASATIPIEAALRKVKNEINLDEYLNYMKFHIS